MLPIMQKQLANRISLIALTLFLSGVCFSCSKSPKCWGDHKNKGIIENSVVIPCEPAFDQGEYVIQDDSSYVNTFNNSVPNISDCSLPPVDFNSYSLLGYYASGACEVKFIREVTKIDSEKRYHYSIIIKSCGACKKESYSFNWVTVPKIPEGWTVTFEKENR